VSDDNERLRARGRGLRQRIDRGALLCARSPGGHNRRERIDIDAPGEIVAVSEQDGGPQRGVVVVLIIRRGEPGICFGIDSVVDVGPIEADQDDLPAPLHRDLRGGAQRDLGHFHVIGDGFAAISLHSAGRRGACQHRRKTAQNGSRLQHAASLEQSRDVHVVHSSSASLSLIVGVERTKAARDHGAQASAQLRGFPPAIDILEAFLRLGPVFMRAF
jgi:hypothetical protein